MSYLLRLGNCETSYVALTGYQEALGHLVISLQNIFLSLFPLYIMLTETPGFLFFIFDAWLLSSPRLKFSFKC